MRLRRGIGKALKGDLVLTPQRMDKDLDELWSEAVKVLAGYRCEVCKTQKQLNSHHIFSRVKRSLRWDVTNGICLCVGHHIGAGFSAHKTSTEFTMWLMACKPVGFLERLAIKSKGKGKLTMWEKAFLKEDLIRIINNKKISK